LNNNQRYKLHHNDCLDVLCEMAENSIDAIVTDPPAGIGFMGLEWDKNKGGRDKWIDWMAEVAAECLRVIKPGGHALVWALPRTSHWTATAWENAGWEPRDRICHIFGSGFPKSANISKQIDRMAGAEREVVGQSNGGLHRGSGSTVGSFTGQHAITAPATDAAKQWDGYGTALKPAVEDYWLFRKPIEKGLNIAQNVLKWGTGGLNIDGCRIGTADDMNPRDFDDSRRSAPKFSGKFNNGQVGQYRNRSGIAPNGRFPAHLIHDGSDEVVRLFPVTSSGFMRGGEKASKGAGMFGGGQSNADTYGDTGSAARFFYCAKPGKSERDAGLEGFALGSNMRVNAPRESEEAKHAALRANIHPTVKALKLMTYLCRLITPPDGLILDPFTGSGSTGCAAMLEGFRFIGMEQSLEYAEIARRRIEYIISCNQVQQLKLLM
jgi:site-specific DNA-methyltransferase (adenine-specific)